MESVIKKVPFIWAIVLISVLISVLIPPFLVLALDFEEVTVLSRSLTGQTIKINRGSVDGVRPKDIAQFMVQSAMGSGGGRVGISSRISPRGEGVAIKVYPHHSIWHFPSIEGENEEKTLLMVTYERGTRGRREFVLKQKKIIIPQEVVEEKGIEEALRDVLASPPHSLAKGGEGHEESEEIVQTEIRKHQDIETTQFDVWLDEGPEGESQKVEDIFQTVNPNTMKEREMKEVFRSTLKGSIAQFNEREGGWDEFYRKQKKDRDIREIREALTVNNVYENYLESLKRRKAALLVAGQEEGPAKSINHEILLRYSLNLSSHSAPVGLINQAQGYALGIGYDFPLGKVHPYLMPFSLELFIDQTIGYYHLGYNTNGRAIEGSLRAMANWYFYHPANTIGQYLWHMGIGIRTGNAIVESQILSKDYRYQVRAFPVVHLGMKYRFPSISEEYDPIQYGIGTHFLISFERMRLAL